MAAKKKTSDNKTTKNRISVQKFIEKIPQDAKRGDALKICELMTELSGEQPAMWGTSIIGFGEYHYQYESGREGDMARIGFSPRAQNFALYLIDGFKDKETLLEKLGKHSTGKSCLYINKLDDIHLPTLTRLIKASLKYMDKTYPRKG